MCSVENFQMYRHQIWTSFLMRSCFYLLTVVHYFFVSSDRILRVPRIE